MSKDLIVIFLMLRQNLKKIVNVDVWVDPGLFIVHSVLSAVAFHPAGSVRLLEMNICQMSVAESNMRNDTWNRCGGWTSYYVSLSILLLISSLWNKMTATVQEAALNLFLE